MTVRKQEVAIIIACINELNLNVKFYPGKGIPDS